MEEKNTNDEINLSLKDILFIIKKHLLVIIACIAVGGIGGLVYDKVQPNEYSAGATLLANINRESGSVSSSDYNLANYLSDTFVQLIKEDRVANETLKAINEKYPEYEMTKGQLTSGISSTCSSLFVNVKFTSTNHEEILDYHQNVVNELVNVVYEISQTTKPGDDSKGEYPLLFNNLSVFSKATKRSLVSHTVKRIAIGAAIGLVVAAVYVVLRELIDNKFKSAEELESYLGLPVLASIPYYTLENFSNTTPSEETKEAKENE